MKRLAFLAPLFYLAPLSTAAVNYTWGTKMQLDNGADSLRIVHRINGVEQDHTVRLSLPLRGAAYQKITVWPAKYRGAKQESACPSPCELAMPLHYGPPKLRAEYFNSQGQKLRESEWIDIPQAAPEPLENYTLPLEVVGFEGYRLPVTVDVAAGTDLSGTNRLYMHCHRCGDMKGDVRVNGSGWIDITKSNATWADQLSLGAGYWGSMDIPYRLQKFFIDLPAGSVKAGRNVVEFRFKREYQEQSGYRVLEFGLFRPNVPCASVNISGSTVTMTCNAHGLATGDDVRVNQFNGVAWRVNGIKRNVTVLNANIFRFQTPESDGKRDGTWTYAGVSVSRGLNDFDAFVLENPAAWTAPAGGNALAGRTAFQGQNLLAPDHPGEAITASCAECHAHDGRDLKYFNYSNWSNIVRSQFHGLSESNAIDIAAYIRSHPSVAPGRVYIPPYQPAPCADTAPAIEWSGCAKLDDILPFDTAMLEQLCGAACDENDFSPTRSDYSFKNARLALPMLDWNDWLPRVHPKDYWNSAFNAANYPAANWPTSLLKQTYETLRSGYSGAGCPSGPGCQTFHTAAASGYWKEQWQFMSQGWLTGWWAATAQPQLCAGMPPNRTCLENVTNEKNQYNVSTYSAGQFVATKIWEIMHEFDIQGYQASLYPSAGESRGWNNNTVFLASPDISKTRVNAKIPGLYDGSVYSEQHASLQWYTLQAILMSTTGRPWGYDTIGPLDTPYTYGKFRVPDGAWGNALWLTNWNMQQMIRYVNNWPDMTGEDRSWYVNAVSPEVLINWDGWAYNWASLPAEDRQSIRASILNAYYEKWRKITGGFEANGTAPPFTKAMWNNNYMTTSDKMPYQDSYGFATQIWQALVTGEAYGVNATVLNNLQALGASIFDGPSSTLASGINASQTSMTIASTPEFWPAGEHQVVIGAERITCASRSGGTLSGCTRGADGTTAASAASGTAARIRIRWERARNGIANGCTLQPDGMRHWGPQCFAIKP